MDAGDAWGRSSSSSSSAAAAARRLQARYDLYMGFDDADAAGVEEVEARGGGEAYNCPFCGEDFDFVAFCCHVDDEHAVEAKSGNTCIISVDIGIFVVLCKYWVAAKLDSFWVCPICATRVGVDLIGHLTMQHGSYFKILPVAEPSKDLHSDSSDNNFLLNKFPDDKTAERAEPSLSEKDQKERAQRSKFVRGLVLSTIFEDDNL
ncbi:hypothetical protein OsJ_18214 [Oryza sativa Japonica Group]|uniref:Drought induced 19 protein type zinc-binding domain-containing protein n=1 Tax=Oryza sativa subsp. japonica TaxID=39947 RepID=B9FP46_ORYSJ|nr:hypothetical protein OsJ_18214 [Oryza sativa Japonica Group]